MNDAERSVGLDIVRATAITCVLIAHFVKSLEFMGFWGVELFFGLSGFFIGRILWRSYSAAEPWGIRDISNFWLRRWYRTLPNYYLFLAITVVVAYISSTQSNTNATAPIAEQMQLVAPYLFFAQDFFDRQGLVFSISWSLCIEEWFYLLFPLTVLTVSQFGLNKKPTFFICLVIFVLGNIFTRAWYSQFMPEANIRGITVARLDSIAYGVLVAITQISIQEKISNKFKSAFPTISALLGIALISITFWIARDGSMTYEQFKKSNAILTLTPFGLALLLPIMEPYRLASSRTVVVFLKKSIINISKWSYSIYLSHILILWMVYWLFGELRSDIFWNTTSKIVGILVTVFISAVVFRWFEKPITSLRPKELGALLQDKSTKIKKAAYQ